MNPEYKHNVLLLIKRFSIENDYTENAVPFSILCS